MTVLDLVKWSSWPGRLAMQMPWHALRCQYDTAGQHPASKPLSVQGAPAGSPVEAAIQCCREQLRSGGCNMSRVKVAEWWAHKRAAKDAHQLHFDLDETQIGSGSAKFKLKHPVRVTALHTPHSSLR